MWGGELWFAGKPVSGRRGNDRWHDCCPTVMAAVSWCHDDDYDDDEDDENGVHGDGDDAAAAAVAAIVLSEWIEWTVWKTERAVAAATWNANLEREREDRLKYATFL